jgi:hypothetical protein
MKIGDQVRFLSEKGGGRVVGFQKGGIVLVEDADGFEIPMLATEVVVVGNENYDTARMVQKHEEKKNNTSSVKALLNTGDSDEAADSEEEGEFDFSKVTFKAPVEERKGGNQLHKSPQGKAQHRPRFL